MEAQTVSARSEQDQSRVSAELATTVQRLQTLQQVHEAMQREHVRSVDSLNRVLSEKDAELRSQQQELIEVRQRAAEAAFDGVSKAEHQSALQRAESLAATVSSLKASLVLQQQMHRTALDSLRNDVAELNSQLTTVYAEKAALEASLATEQKNADAIASQNLMDSKQESTAVRRRHRSSAISGLAVQPADLPDAGNASAELKAQLDATMARVQQLERDLAQTVERLSAAHARELELQLLLDKKGSQNGMETPLLRKKKACVIL